MSAEINMGLSAAVKAQNKGAVRAELSKLIPNPREALPIDQLRSLFALMSDLQNPILIEFLFTELTKYIHERGYQFEAIIFLAHNCAAYLKPEELVAYFYKLSELYPKTQDYQEHFRK